MNIIVISNDTIINLDSKSESEKDIILKLIDDYHRLERQNRNYIRLARWRLKKDPSMIKAIKDNLEIVVRNDSKKKDIYEQIREYAEPMLGVSSL